MIQGALRRELVGQAVGERIREGNAKFEYVRPALYNGQTGREGRFKVRVTRAQVGDERRAVLGAGAGEGFPDA